MKRDVNNDTSAIGMGKHAVRFGPTCGRTSFVFGANVKSLISFSSFYLSLTSFVQFQLSFPVFASFSDPFSVVQSPKWRE